MNIDSPEFWSERLQKTLNDQRPIHTCINDIDQETMDSIDIAHSQIINSLLPSGSNVLDAWCGYGRLVPFLKHCKYQGVDLCPDFIELAKERNPLVSFQEGTLGSLPFKDREFNWVVCSGMEGTVRGNLGHDRWERMESELKRIGNNVLLLEYTDPYSYSVFRDSGVKVRYREVINGQLAECAPRVWERHLRFDQCKPVTTEKFWKQRLLNAHVTGRGLHTAVYDTDPENWDNIQNQTRNLIHKYASNKSVILDAGCAYGPLYSLIPNGAAYVGIDISPDFIEIAGLRNPGADFRVGDLSNLKEFPDRFFDLTICRAVENMLKENNQGQLWERIRRELIRVSNTVLLMDYGTEEIIWEVINNPLATRKSNFVKTNPTR